MADFLVRGFSRISENSFANATQKAGEGIVNITARRLQLIEAVLFTRTHLVPKK